MLLALSPTIPSPPLSPHLLVGQEHTVGVFMLTGHLVALQSVCQLVDKPQHFFMPRDVRHGDAGGFGRTTVGDTL